MDPFLAFLAIFGTSTAIYLFSIGTGIVMDRWARSAGLESGKRISSARLAAGMACIIYGAALGAFLATVHVALLALTVPIGVGGLIAGILLFKGGEETPPPPPREHAGPRHAGFAYFWRCWIPLRVHDFGRAALAALLTPLVVVVAVIAENWVLAGIFGALGVLSLGRDRDRQTQERSALRAVRPR